MAASRRQGFATTGCRCSSNGGFRSTRRSKTSCDGDAKRWTAARRWQAPVALPTARVGAAPHSESARLWAREPLLEGGGERRIAVHLDAVLIGLATTHQHPVKPFGGSAHGDVGLGMTRFGHRLPAVRAPAPFTPPAAGGAVEARRLALPPRPPSQPRPPGSTRAPRP